MYVSYACVCVCVGERGGFLLSLYESESEYLYGHDCQC